MRIGKTITNAMSRLGSGLMDRLRFGQRAQQGRVYAPTPSLDQYRMLVAKGLTPASLDAMLQAGDSGDLATTLRLFEEMEEKDLHLHSVANTRRMALTGLEWEIVPAPEVDADKPGDQRQLADEAARLVGEALCNLTSFEEGLEHLAQAIGPNLSVVELVWQNNELEEIVPIPSWRLTTNFRNHDVRITTQEEPSTGVPANPGKFVVHKPKTQCGFPFAGSLSRVQAFIWLIKLYALADWATYVERFGIPVRWAKYNSKNTPEEEKEKLAAMLKNMGSDAWAMFSDAVELSVLESSQRGTAPHEALINWCDRKQSILFLGGHLMVDTTNATGTQAAGTVQDQVRGDLLEDDIRRESRTIRRQLIAPMVLYRFAGRDVPLPVFRRVKPEIVDRLQEAQLLTAAQQAGIQVPRDWAHDRLGIPKPEEGEDILEPSLDAFGQGMTEEVGGALA